MKKEIKNAVITLLVMSVITILFLYVISFCTFTYKWKSPVAMQGITFTYIFTGLSGGLLYGWLSRKKGIGMALLYGIVLASLYWCIPGGVAMLIFKENISNMGRFAVVWSMMAGSVTAGILISTGIRRKGEIRKGR